MTRGGLGRGAGLLALTLVLGALSAAPGTDEAKAGLEPPNVLIVVTDDQRATGGTLNVMPRTRRWFEAGGTRFTHAFATTPLCCPARASIFSGRYAHNHGVYTNQGKPEFNHSFTIQDYLDDQGYRTALVGKYFNEWPLGTRPPHFDRWSMFQGGYFNAPFNIDGTITEVARYSTGFMAGRSVDYLRAFERTDDTPWFLYVAPYGPHAPFAPSPRDEGRPVSHWSGNPAVFESNRSDKPPYVLIRNETYATWKKNRRLQLRSLMSVDRLMGRIRSALQDLDENKDTLVFFLSDNGYLWADHGLYDKGAPYTPSIQIPMLMRYPGSGLEATDRRLVANIDIAPTVLDAAGIVPAPGHPMDGRSLLAPAWTRDRILTEYRNNDNIWTPPTWASTRTRRVQYVEYYEGAERIFRELYRLERDPWQLHNVLRDGRKGNDPSAPRLQELAARLAADRACEGLTCP